MSMKADIYEKFGEPSEVLHPTEVPIPEIKAGQVLVKTSYAVIHNHNVSTVKGVYGFKPQLPYVDGSEGSGTIEKVGEGVTHVKVGQRIATARSVTGTWAQYFVADAKAVVPIPDMVDDESAAQITSMPLSAFLLLDTLAVKEGEWFAYNGANGLVGIFLASIAKAKGINMLKIVRREGAKKDLEKLGYDAVVSTSDADWKEQAKKIVGEGKLVAGVDNVGGEDGTELLNLLDHGAKLVIFGSLTGKPLSLGPGAFLFEGKQIVGFWVSAAIKTTPVETIIAHQTEIIKLVASKQIKIPVGGVFNLDEIKEAIKASVVEKQGKILLKAN